MKKPDEEAAGKRAGERQPDEYETIQRETNEQSVREQQQDGVHGEQHGAADVRDKRFPDGELFRSDAPEEDPFADPDWDEAEEEAYFARKARNRQRIKKGLAIVVSLALLGNVIAFWPSAYPLEAIRFLNVSRTLSKQDNIAQYKKAIVMVRAEQSKGTGFLIADAAGTIVTNHHVVGSAERVLVEFADGRVQEAEVISSKEETDIAILHTVLDGDAAAAYHPLPLQQPASWERDEAIYLIGNPWMFNRIANQGTLLGDIQVRGLSVPALALAAPVFQGNSGSPVFNASGDVIGVVFATTEITLDGKTQRVGLAVPAAYVWEQLVHNKQ